MFFLTKRGDDGIDFEAMSNASSWIESTICLPHESPGDWVTLSYQFGGREILLTRPRDPDKLLDDPSVQQASKANDYMPYWAYLWPGAILLAQRVLSVEWPTGAQALEIGCGLGLAGLAGLFAGLQVTFSDYSPAALALAAHNARLNGFQGFATRIVDWQHPPRETYNLVLGADVLYESRCLTDVLRVLDCMLGATGTALFADPGRVIAGSFEKMARARGYVVQCESAAAQSRSGRKISGRIFRLRHGRNLERCK